MAYFTGAYIYAVSTYSGSFKIVYETSSSAALYASEMVPNLNFIQVMTYINTEHWTILNAHARLQMAGKGQMFNNHALWDS